MGAAQYRAAEPSTPTCPVTHWAVSIWEEIIGLERPRVVVGVLCSHVLGWSGIEGVDAAILIEVVDQLVHVFVVLVGRDPLEVGAKGNQDVIPVGDTSQVLGRANKVIYSVLDVVVIQAPVILHTKTPSMSAICLAYFIASLQNPTNQ